MVAGVNQQREISDLFARTIEKQQLGHAYVFEGAAGTGKKMMALWVASSLFCEQRQAGGFPCGECANCVRINTHQHPDVVEVAPDGNSIKVDQVRELKAEFSKSGVESNRKVFIIEDAEKMTAGAANSLLKFLEEPEGDVTAFLLTTAKNRLLPTILSRCQEVHFSPFPKDQRRKELEEKGVSSSKAALLVHLTQDMEKAVEWSEDEWFQSAVDTILRFRALLDRKDPQAFVFIQTDLMPVFKERPQQELALELLLTCYRDLLNYHYNRKEDLAFPQRQAELEAASNSFSGRQIVHTLTVLLESRKMLDSYVAAQGVFEQIVLKLMDTK
ncbi:DNA polymerase III subunit delta' [Atopococcus tabaci]|uniref:DNA polymerase III subunit delta' n=1 Tax=Atopococcus tabaci TaxID=269774 RepID=UPI000408F2D7|nr:DNA polymerase III subunit delta' [Atopococcus tabaci]